MITPRGAGWVILTLLVGVALAYSGLKPLQFLFLLMLIIPVSSLGWLIWTRHRTQLGVTLSHQMIQRGQRFTCRTTIYSRSRLLLGLAVMVVQQSGSDQYHDRVRRTFVLDTRQEKAIQFQCRAKHCGVMTIAITECSVRDVFGFFKLSFAKKQTNRSRQIISVLPGPYPFNRLEFMQDLLKENPMMLRWQVGNELNSIANIRQQQPGDALKQAHWKLSARLNEVMIREFENPLQPEVVLIVDSHFFDGSDRQTGWLFHDFESECLVYLAQMILGAKYSVRVVLWRQSEREAAVAATISHKEAIQLLLCEPRKNDHWKAEFLFEDEIRQHREAAMVFWISSRLEIEAAQKMTAFHTVKQPLICLLLRQAQMPKIIENKAVQELKRASIQVIEADYETYRDAVKNKIDGWDDLV